MGLNKEGFFFCPKILRTQYVTGKNTDMSLQSWQLVIGVLKSSFIFMSLFVVNECPSVP